MMQGKRARYGVWLVICLLVAGGCLGCRGRPTEPEPAPPEGETPTRGPESVAITGSVIRMAGPEGEWTFEARSERGTAEGMDGPYVLAPMEGRYEREGRPPVLMGADRAEVDKAANRVTLEGSVWVQYAGSQLEADRVEYDLGTGKVVAEGRTKWTFADERRGAGASAPVGKEGTS
jgi:hypothetical protein